MNKHIKILIIICSVFYFLSNGTFLFAATNPTAKDKFISYTDAGQGKPLILIHAFPTDQRLWKPQQVLKNYFRVITLDLWGFGLSAKVDGRVVTMNKYADEVKLLLDQLHIKKAIIGGESMGGYIALAFLGKYPAMINGLILSDTQSIADSPEGKIKREAQAVEVLHQGTTSLIEGFMTKALSSQAPEPVQAFLRHIIKTQAQTAVASALRGMAARHDTSSLLANTSSPILIMTADKDTVIPSQQSAYMKQLTKNSRLVLIKNAGHLSSLEQPEQWNKAVIDMFYKG